MWKLYISGNEGLAIRTTYQSLICSLRDAPQEFLIGKVRYTKPSAGSSMLLTCMTKREPFTHEKEVRVIWHNAKAEQSLDNNDADTQPSTIELDCDFQQLVDEVYVSPKAGAWFAPAIRDLLKKYKLKDVKVSQSVLSGKPQWPK